jgi:acyl-coenzyme A synthetase/AMP-(fatty) acid ligase
MMWEGWYGLLEQDRVLHAGAFNWTYTLGTGLLDPWTRGATALIPGNGVASEELGLLLKQHDATIFAAVPRLYRRLLGSCPGSKAAPGPVCRREASRRHPLRLEKATGTPIHEAFGMSECSTFISGSPSGPAPGGTLGYPQRGRSVAVLGKHGPVSFGEFGIVGVSFRDPGLMLGYWGAEEETSHRFRGEWFLTGDTMSMAEDGALTYLGGADDRGRPCLAD